MKEDERTDMTPGDLPNKKRRRSQIVLLIAAAAIVVLIAGYFGAPPMIRTLRRHPGGKLSPQQERRARTPGGANSVAMQMNARGNTYSRQGRYAEAVACYRQALEVARRFNLRDRAEASMEMLGVVFERMGEFDSAAVYYQKGRDITNVSGDVRDSMSLLMNEGASMMKDPRAVDLAPVVLRRALTLAERENNAYFIKNCTYNLGVSYLYGFEPDSCIRWLRIYLDLINDKTSRPLRVAALHNLALAFCQAREWDSAYAVFSRVLEDDNAAGDRINVWYVEQAMSKIREVTKDSKSYPLPKVPLPPKPRQANLEFQHYLMRLSDD